MEVNTNKFLEKYKEERESGTEEFKAFGIAVSHILDNGGSLDDVNTVYDFFMQDFLEETAREFENYRKYIETSYQRGMRLSGHKQSDFE